MSSKGVFSEHRNQQVEENVIIKYAEHFRVARERDMLSRFQGRTKHIRPLLDVVEIEHEDKGPALVLKWLNEDVLRTCTRRPLSRPELKRVARGVLEALEVLHGEGFVHTDVKPSNVTINYAPSSEEISDVQLIDLESTVQQESDYAKKGDAIGTPMFRSTEAQLRMPWGTATDVWSFGTTMISLIYGGGFHMFAPGVPVDHEDHDTNILMKQNAFFGPFPKSYVEIADDDRLGVLLWVIKNMTSAYTPFRNITVQEVSSEDKRFLLKVMKLDPRDRPTVSELLTVDHRPLVRLDAVHNDHPSKMINFPNRTLIHSSPSLHEYDVFQK